MRIQGITEIAGLRETRRRTVEHCCMKQLNKYLALSVKNFHFVYASEQNEEREFFIITSLPEDKNYNIFYFREGMSKAQPPAERKPPGPGSKRPPFSWEEICMYLYGHTPVEPAVLEDQRKHLKQEENGPGTH